MEGQRHSGDCEGSPKYASQPSSLPLRPVLLSGSLWTGTHDTAVALVLGVAGLRKCAVHSCLILCALDMDIAKK